MCYLGEGLEIVGYVLQNYDLIAFFRVHPNLFDMMYEFLFRAREVNWKHSMMLCFVTLGFMLPWQVLFLEAYLYCLMTSYFSATLCCKVLKLD